MTWGISYALIVIYAEFGNQVDIQTWFLLPGQTNLAFLKEAIQA